MDHYCPEPSTVGNNGKVDKKGGGKRGKVVKLSTDPQSVAARQRRHRISDRFKILQSMVPGGTKMDTVSMLEEAIHYVKFLKTQIWLHRTMMTSPVEDHPTLDHHHHATLYSSGPPNVLPDHQLQSLPPLPLPLLLPLPLPHPCFQNEVQTPLTFNPSLNY